jgi:hypothetical protein
MPYRTRALAILTMLIVLGFPPIKSVANTSEGFLSNINNSASRNNSTEIVLSPTVNKAFVKKVRANIKRAIDATDEIARIERFSVYLFTVKDAVWLKDILAKYEIEQYMPASSAKQYLKSANGKDCGQAFTAKINGSSAFFQCTPYDGAGGDSSTHEVFHMLQDTLGHFSSENSKTPLWLSEGSAVYFQDLLTESSLGKQIQYISFSKKGLVKKLTNLEATFDPQSKILNRNNGYVIGANAVEFIIQKYGYKKFVDFNKKIIDSQSWQDSFIDVYKKSPKRFYAEVANEVARLYH